MIGLFSVVVLWLHRSWDFLDFDMQEFIALPHLMYVDPLFALVLLFGCIDDLGSISDAFIPKMVAKM